MMVEMQLQVSWQQSFLAGCSVAQTSSKRTVPLLSFVKEGGALHFD